MPWSIDSPDDVARLINLILCAAVVVMAVCRWRAYLELSRGDQMLRMAVLLFVISTAVGSVETLADASPSPGIRSYLLTLALAWVLVSGFLESRDTHHPRKGGPRGPQLP